MQVALLDRRRPELDLDAVADRTALYEGGEAMEKRMSCFIHQRQFEPNVIYEQRVKAAHYLNYAGPIVDYFVAALFTGRLEMRLRGSGEAGAGQTPPPDWFSDFKEDCDATGTDLVDFFYERTAEALKQRVAWVLVDFPKATQTPQDRLDWEKLGLGDGYLCALNVDDVVAHRCDQRGNLLWAIVKSVDDQMDDPMATVEMVTETWTLWTRDEWRRWQYLYEKGKRDPKAVATETGNGKHATPGHVPLVRLDVGRPLWVMNRIKSPQVEQMRSRNGLSWSLQRTSYAMRIFQLKDPSQPPVQGPGYGMVMGLDEKVVWDAPPSEAFTPMSSYSETTKDEIYRVAHQMALGVKNNAAAVGRSGQSKEADNDSTEIVLRAIAPKVREAIQKVLSLYSLGRGEADSKWHVTGLDSFNVKDVGALVDTSIAADTLSIPSPTWKRLHYKRVALATVPDASQEERDTICEEIEKNVPDELEPRAVTVAVDENGVPIGGAPPPGGGTPPPTPFTKAPPKPKAAAVAA